MEQVEKPPTVTYPLVTATSTKSTVALSRHMTTSSHFSPPHYFILIKQIELIGKRFLNKTRPDHRETRNQIDDYLLFVPPVERFARSATDGGGRGGVYNPRTVEKVYRDYQGRRNGLIKALTTDVERFYRQCDPEKDNLCLYGHPNESWEVYLPEPGVPPLFPEPTLGINFERDGMDRKDWLKMVALHGDCWLLTVAFYFGERLDRNERTHLFSLINNLPRVVDVVTEVKPVKIEPSAVGGSSSRGITKPVKIEPSAVGGSASGGIMKPVKIEPSAVGGSTSRGIMKPVKIEPSAVGGSTSGGITKRSVDRQVKVLADKGEHITPCRRCHGIYQSWFWIRCDFCKEWFHGMCVQVSEVESESMEHFKCLYCVMKEPRSSFGF